MSLPPFPTDEELMTLDTFPYLEGKQYEFKQTFNKLMCAPGEISNPPKTFERIVQTCCAFLNGDGGYIVCGVRDKDRKMVWMEIDGIEMDKILLRFDNIFHCKSIYTTDLEDVRPENIQTRVLTKAGRYLIVVTVKPTPGKEYRTHEYKWVRLNASNYAINKEKFFRAKDVSGLLYMERAKVIAKYEFAMQMKDATIEKLRSKLYLDHDTLELMLTQKILAEKRQAEKQLEMEKASCLLSAIQMVATIFNSRWKLISP